MALAVKNHTVLFYHIKTKAQTADLGKTDRGDPNILPKDCDDAIHKNTDMHANEFTSTF